MMTIRYRNGRNCQAVILASTETTMRVAVEEMDDVLTLNRIEGVWITEDCEPVELRFSWDRGAADTSVTVEDCVCSRELAARLISRLLGGHEDPAPDSTPVSRAVAAPACHTVI